MAATPVRVLIADDHRLIREGTAALLLTDDRIEIVGMARHGREAVQLAVRRRPDVVLLDLKMPVLGGIEAGAAIRQQAPEAKVLVLTMSDREPDLYAALRVGASGYLLKDMPPRELIDAVVHAGEGSPRIAPELAGRLLADLSEQPESGRRGPLEALSDRECEVLALLAEALTNREIADRLVITEATVKTHVRHVLEKLHLRNRAQAAAFAAGHRD